MMKVRVILFPNWEHPVFADVPGLTIREQNRLNEILESKYFALGSHHDYAPFVRAYVANLIRTFAL